jgi:hypothetical protein
MTNVGRNYDEYWTKLRQTSNETKWNGTEQHYRAICICELYNDGVQKRKEKFFFFYFVFFYYIILRFPRLLQGLLTT